MEKKLFVSKPSLPPIDEYIEYVNQIWANRYITNNGPLHVQFESMLKKYLHADQIALFTNGHLALETALQVLDLKGEVITTPFTFASTTHAITRNGLTPVFCDIDDTTFNIDVRKIEDLITERTSAILAVHVFGVPCDIESIQTIADKYNLKVIYDAAHAFGVTYKGKPISSYGDISMFSFHATKVFHSIEGGALIFKDPNLKRGMEKLKNFGIENEERVDLVGFNAKMNEFQAAMGLLNLKRLPESIEKRKNASAYYNLRLKNIDHVKIMESNDSITFNYAYYPIVIQGGPTLRNQVHEFMKSRNIMTRKYFYPLCSDFDCYKHIKSDVEVAKEISNAILILPLYEDISEEELDYICISLEQAVKEDFING